MVGIMYVKNVGDENKVCCTLLECDTKETTLKQLSGLEEALNKEARKKGYVTGKFVADVLHEVLGVHTIFDPDSHLSNVEINIF